MSSLGWLIWFVGLCETISNAEGWIIVLLVVASIGITAVRLVVVLDATVVPNDNRRLAYGHSLFRWSMAIYFGLFLSILIQFIIPSKQTAIFIAASEVSQRVLQSDQAKAVGARVSGVLDPSVELLSTWIKKEQTKQQYQLDDIIHSHDEQNRSH